MKVIYLTVLLFAFVASTLAFEEFFDSRGECWRCYPGRPCERCPRFSNHAWPIGWSDMCFEPNCNVAENRRFRFPSRESDRFFRCVFNHDHWTYETVACRCGTLFDMRAQECITPRNWTPYCVELVTPIMMRSCESGHRVRVNTNVRQPQLEEDVATREVVTWTPDPEFTESTTNGDNGNGDDCKCVPWFPCWCMPCWPMCGGMMMG